MLSLPYELLRQTASAKTVLTALGIVTFIGFATERNIRAVIKRKSLSMKKVSLPVASTRQLRSHTRSKTPLAPVSSGIQRRRQSKSLEQDYNTTVILAIEKAKAALTASDLKELVTDELYEFVCGYHPKNQPSAKFIAAVMQDVGEYRDYDWKSYLQNRRSRLRYKSFNAGASPKASPRRTSLFETYIEDCSEYPSRADEVQPIAYPIVSPSYMHLALPLGPVSLKRNYYPDYDSPPQSPRQQDRRKSSDGLVVPVFMSGGVRFGDWQVIERLRAKVGPADNAVVCTRGHPEQAKIQGWRLVSKKKLPFTALFHDPEAFRNRVPNDYYTTHLAMDYVVRMRFEMNLEDETVLKALVAFGSALGGQRDKSPAGSEPLMDVEHMRPYNPKERWYPEEKQYWEAHSQWKHTAMQDLGMYMLGDGTYVTAYDEEINARGWEPYRSGATRWA